MLNSDIDIGVKIHATLIEGIKDLNIHGRVVYIHDKQFVIAYKGGDGENIAVLPLPKYMDKENYYEIQN